MINDKVDPFITQYRDALERERDLGMQNLDNTRRNDFAGIMGAANTAGMMYSNFPQRTKIQYDTTNYMPSQSKIQNTYQTGLDKLRTNVVSLSNQLKNINEAISDLNKTGGSGSNGNGSNGNGSNGNGSGEKVWDYGNGYTIKGTKDGEATYYKDGKQISSGQFLWNTGVMGSGPKWDIWNEMWNNGVKTNGVNGDVVGEFIPKNYKKLLEPEMNEKYSYLY